MRYRVDINIDYSREIEAESEDVAIVIAEEEIMQYGLYDYDIEPIGEEDDE